MIFECRLLPQVVSFKELELIEWPRVSTDSVGYYMQPSKAGLLDHGLHGAGKWNEVGDENTVGDLARMEINDSPWLGGGSFTWPIPNAWRIKDNGGEGTYFCDTDQRFELDADGTSRLKKFYRAGERTTNGVYRTWETN